MMKIVLRFLTVLLLFAGMRASAQQPIALYDDSKVYNEAVHLFEHEKFAAAQHRFEEYIKVQKDPQHALRINSEYYRGVCALYLLQKDAEFLLEAFVREHPDSPWKKEAYFELASFYYKNKSYKKSLEWFDLVDPADLTNDQRIAFYYKRHSRLKRMILPTRVKIFLK
ncbi:MAG: tetratricopeptide repeat protein [Flavobacteriales bacterium]